MAKSGTSTNVFITAGLVILLLLAGRGYVACWDFSYFFVAGTDFVDQSATPAPVWVQQGQGYDGQFFYRYALHPFDFSKTNYGVTVDLVPYRMQRIGYPFLCWLISFGGLPWLVPYALVLINVLAFFGILFFTRSFLDLLPDVRVPVYLPLFLCGLYMSLARDLSEITELFFFTAAIYYLFRKDYKKFAVAAALTILTRETALIALLPLVLITVYWNYKNKINLAAMLYLFIPFAVFVCWKLVIAAQTTAGPVISGSGNIGMPFSGILSGFMGNLDVSTAKNKLQLLFWILYFIWQIVLIALVIYTLLYHRPAVADGFFMALAGAFLFWLLFAIFLSPAIYIDDWSFVRVFSLWNMIGFMILFFRNRPIPSFFRIYSMVLVALTLVRLIIRP